MASSLGRAGRSGLAAITDFILSGGKPAAKQIQRLLPALEMSGNRTLQNAGRRAAVQAGLTDELTAFPSVVSRQGGNLGLLGVRPPAPNLAPTPSNLNPALRGLTGQAEIGALNPEMQAIIRAAEQSRTSTPSAPGVRGVSPLVQNRPPVPLAEAPKPPVRYPEPAPAGQTARQMTMLKPGEGEVGSMGTRLTYRPGTEGLEGRLGSTTYGQGVEVGATSAYPRMTSGSPAQEQMRLSSQLNRGPSTAEMPGAPLLQTNGANQYVAPRPAFGPSATGVNLDRIADLAFGAGRGAGAGADVMQGGRGGALVRSPGGQVVDELMINPVRVKEIFEANPQLFNNAAGGIQMGNLGNLLSDPRILAALGAAGLGAAGFGAASMMSGESENKVGKPTAQVPAVGTTPLFTEDGVVPLGDGAPSVAPPTAPGPGVIDPSAAAAPIITSGGVQRESAVREALAQAAPAAAAVQRAVEPMSPEKYRSIEDYYAAREAYTRNAGQRRELMKYMEGQSSTLGSQLAQWAQQNPALAYEYQRRQLANPAANQQSAEAVTTTTVTTPMGSETAANAVGNAEAVGQAVTNPNQASFAMVDATRPQIQSYLQRMAPRSAMYAGY